MIEPLYDGQFDIVGGVDGLVKHMPYTSSNMNLHVINIFKIFMKCGIGNG